MFQEPQQVVGELQQEQPPTRGLFSSFVVPGLELYLEEQGQRLEILPGYFQVTKIVQPSVRGQLPVAYLSDGVTGVQGKLKLGDQVVGGLVKDFDVVKIITSTGHPMTNNLIIVSFLPDF